MPGSSKPHSTSFIQVFVASVMFCLLWPTVAKAQQTEIVGVPWRGQPGITESVADIMAREHAQGPRVPQAPVIPPRGRAPHSQTGNPNPPKGGQPQAGGVAGLEIGSPTMRSAIAIDSPLVFNAQSVGTLNFLGPTFADSGFLPPDSMGAVGPTQIVVGINGKIKTYDKTSGTWDGQLDTSMDNFFASVCSCTPSGPHTSDPRVVFDVLSQRWFVTMINTNTPNRVLIAVSSGANITSNISSSFTFFQFQQDMVGITPNLDTGFFADFPTLGVDANALYIGVNVFQDDTGINYQGATAFVIKKADLLLPLGQAKLTATPFRHLLGGSIRGMFSPIAATNMDPNATMGYFAATAIDSLVSVYIRPVQFKTDGTFALVSFNNDNFNVAISVTDPIGVPAKGSNWPLSPIDRRLMSAQWVNGSMWITHGIGLNSTISNGPIASVTSSGTAIGTGSQTAIGQDSTSGTGTGATVTVTESSGTYTVFVNNPGSGYAVNDTIIINGSRLNGSTPANNLTIRVVAITTPIDRNGMRFYEITGVPDLVATPTPSVRQSGTMFDSSPTTSPLSYWSGGIATSGQGHTVLASSYAGPNAYPGVAFAGRLAGDTLGTISSPPTVLASGNGAYNLQSGAAQRWGDYGKVAVDPTDNMTMWSFIEYAGGTNGSWGIQVSQIKAPPPATPSTALPVSAPAGTTTSVTITGLSTSGSGFYDPGPGPSFLKHLSATVSGGGDVKVNSATYTDPTHITLSVTIQSGAAQTSRTVTVTNPDGQSITSATPIFLVTAPELITLAPVALPTGTTGLPYTTISGGPVTLTATGGTGPYTYSILAGGVLPLGLSLNGTTGVISGTPTTSGSQVFTVQAMDSFSVTSSTQYTLKIANLITSNFSLSINSGIYDATTLPNYPAGQYTLNTTLTNNGATVNSPIYLQLTALAKIGADLDTQHPDRLVNPDSGQQGIVGDTKQIATTLNFSQSTPLTLLVGIGSKQKFSLWFDLYTVLPGAALTVSNGVVFKPQVAVATLTDVSVAGAADTAVGGTPVLIGQFHLDINDAIPPATPPDSNFTGDPLSNVGVITGPGPQSRPAVAVDPIIPKHIAIAATDYASQSVRVSTSQDGGFTWHATTLSRSVLNQNFATAGNPSLAFDSHGRLSVVYTLANLFDSANAIVISESSDGINFSPPAAITFHAASEGILDSRPVIATRANAGRYVAWDSLSLATLRYSINLVRSEEGGSFGPVTTVVSNGLVSSPALALSKNRVYIGWDDWGFNSSAPYTSGGRLMITSSSHSGQGEQEESQGDNQRGRNKLVFGAPQEIARTSIGFAQKITAMPEKGVGPNLSLAVDPKKEDVYAVFADRGNGMDIFFARSPNGGKKWQITTVNDDKSAADQFSPAIAVDEDGRINVSFYDTRLSSTFETAHIFLARSSDGKSFDNKRITNASSNDSRSNPLRDYTANLGDQTAVAITDGDAIVAWTDTRLDSEDIFTSIVFDPFGAFVTGSGKIVSAAGAYSANPALAGTAEFGFDFEYKKNSSVPAGETEFKFTPAKAKSKFGFQSTSYDSLVITGAMAQFKGSGKVNGGGNYAFLVTITDGNQPGAGGRDKFRIKIVDNATGAVVYDNVPGAPDQINIASPEAITEGKIKIVN